MGKPQKLGDLVGINLENWKVTIGFFLESNGLAAIPVVVKKKLPVVTTDREVLTKIGRSFPGSDICERPILCNEKLRIFFLLHSGEMDFENKPSKLFSPAELEDLLGSNALSWRGV